MAQNISTEQRQQYERVLKLVNSYMQLSMSSEEGLNSAEMNALYHKIRGAAITALDALLYTGLYAELRRHAGIEE